MDIDNEEESVDDSKETHPPQRSFKINRQGTVSHSWIGRRGAKKIEEDCSLRVVCQSLSVFLQTPCASVAALRNDLFKFYQRVAKRDRKFMANTLPRAQFELVKVRCFLSEKPRVNVASPTVNIGRFD